jgi:ABC-2 type transport system permease protein
VGAGGGAGRAGFDPTNVSLTAALTVGQFAVGVLGVLCMTDESSSGMIRSTLAAVPSRSRLLTAKAAVLALVTLLAGEAVTFATFLAGQAALESGKAPHAALGQPGVLRAVALSGAYLALLALFGLGLGTVIRSRAGAVAAYTGIVLVLPLLLAAVPGHPARFTPETMLTSSVAAVTPQAASHSLPSGWDGLLLMAAYPAATLAVGGVLFARRDA